MVVRNQKTYMFLLICFEHRQFAFLPSGFPTIHNGYCVSNAADYAMKNDVLPPICQLN